MPLQGPIILAADVSGRSQCAFLGSDGPGAKSPASLGVFVTDRYGELHAQWLAQTEAGLPPVRELLSCLSKSRWHVKSVARPTGWSRCERKAVWESVAGERAN